MVQPENPQDPLAQYYKLLDERATLMNVEHADPNVASLYALAAHEIDRQIEEVRGPLVDHSVAEATASLTALEQLDNLSRLSVAESLGPKVQEQQEVYKARVGKAATFLMEHSAEDPRAQLIKEAAIAVGALAAEAETQDDTQQDVGAEAPIVTPYEEQSEQVTLQMPDLTEISARLQDYLGSLQDDYIGLTPSELWSVVAPGIPYGTSATKSLLRKLMEAGKLSDAYKLAHNGRRGRGSVYTLSPGKGRTEQSPGDDPAAQVTPEKFDVNEYFSTNDASLLAAFLYKFEGFLREHDIPPISSEAVAMLLESSEDEQATSNNAGTLRALRAQSVAKIGVLFENHDLLEQAIDQIDASDPRQPLFNYLSDILDSGTYGVLLDLLRAEKEYIIAIDEPRQGQRVIGVDGVVRLPAGSTLEQMRHALTSDHPHSEDLAAIAADEAAQESSSAQPPESGDTKDELPTRSAELGRIPENPRLAECKRIIGGLLNDMAEGGLDFGRDTHSLRSLHQYFGGNINKIVGAARERGLLSRPASGNNNTQKGLGIADAVVAYLGSHADRRVQAYAIENRKQLRKIVERAVANIRNNAQ